MGNLEDNMRNLTNRLRMFMEENPIFVDLIDALNYNSIMVALQQGLITKEEVLHSELFQRRQTGGYQKAKRGY